MNELGVACGCGLVVPIFWYHFVSLYVHVAKTETMFMYFFLVSFCFTLCSCVLTTMAKTEIIK